jgi:hypothetical protein
MQDCIHDTVQTSMLAVMVDPKNLETVIRTVRAESSQIVPENELVELANVNRQV